MTERSTEHPRELPDTVEFPSTLRITSKPFEATAADTVARAERWDGGEAVPHVVNFQDASRLQRVLTPRRLELVRSLMNAPADSIRDLADRLDRDVRQVHDDVTLLGEYRIVHFEADGSAKRPVVPYETVRIEVELEVSSEESAGSSGDDSDSSTGGSPPSTT